MILTTHSIPKYSYKAAMPRLAKQFCYTYTPYGSSVPWLVGRYLEIDEQKQDPWIPIPRGLGNGPSRPGFMPLRLFMLLQLIKKAYTKICGI